MPAKYTKTYTGDADLIYDAAKNNALFIQSTYDYNADLGMATDYAFSVYKTPELTSDTNNCTITTVDVSHINFVANVDSIVEFLLKLGFNKKDKVKVSIDKM